MFVFLENIHLRNKLAKVQSMKKSFNIVLKKKTYLKIQLRIEDKKVLKKIANSTIKRNYSKRVRVIEKN